MSFNMPLRRIFLTPLEVSIFQTYFKNEQYVFRQVAFYIVYLCVPLIYYWQIGCAFSQDIKFSLQQSEMTFFFAVRKQNKTYSNLLHQSSPLYKDMKSALNPQYYCISENYCSVKKFLQINFLFSICNDDITFNKIFSSKSTKFIIFNTLTLLL